MKIAVFGQSYKTDSLSYIKELLQLLKGHDVYILDLVYDLLKDKIDETYPTFSYNSTFKESCDYMISVGGDGTILRAATIIRDTNVPVIGINTGRLGFLATIHKEDMKEAVEQLLAGNYHINKRSLLEVKTNKDVDLGIDFALNEVSISRQNASSMIMINIYLNDDFLNSYWADGLIIATPTGSTGYSLSCNGPIITPVVEALAITPIASHNLSTRPLVIRDDTAIRLQINSREEHFLLSMDSRSISLDVDTEVYIKKADFHLNMIELDKQNFLKTLRDKLLWGKDARNFYNNKK